MERLSKYQKQANMSREESRVFSEDNMDRARTDLMLKLFSDKINMHKQKF